MCFFALFRNGSYGTRSYTQRNKHLGPTGPRWTPCWPREPCYPGNTDDKLHVSFTPSIVHRFMIFLLRVLPFIDWYSKDMSLVFIEKDSNKTELSSGFRKKVSLFCWGIFSINILNVCAPLFNNLCMSLQIFFKNLDLYSNDAFLRCPRSALEEYCNKQQYDVN